MSKQWPGDAVVRSLLHEVQGPVLHALEEQLDQQLINGAEFREHVAAMEAELIDDYVTGRLTPALRARFEAYYLPDAERARKVEFARQLQWALPTTSVHNPNRWWASSTHWRVAAAVLAFATLTTTATWRAWRMGQEPREEDTRVPLPVTDPPVRAAAPRRTASSQQLTFSLAPGGSRALGAGQSLTVPTSAQSVQLELQWPASVGTTYRAVMMTPDGDEVWRTATVFAQPRGDSSVLSLNFSPQRIPPGDYVIRLSARPRDGIWQDVADYVFRLKHGAR